MIDIIEGPGVQGAVSQALAAGLAVHGVEHRLVASTAEAESPVVACWGWRRGRFHRARGQRVLVIERAYVGDRMHWISLGFDGLNGRAQFPKVADRGERWERYFAGLLKPWRKKQGYALLLGQVPQDMAVRMVNYPGWLAETTARLAQRGWKVRFRAHPLAPALECGARRIEGELDEALAGATFAVAWNSNASLDAVLAGVPTVTCDPGAMAWEVTSHELDHPILMPEREAWAYALAWKQWLPEEIASGAAWERLKELL